MSIAPATPPRTRTPRTLAWLTAAAVLAAALACWLLSPRTVVGTPTLAPSSPITVPLPWPGEGQASAEIEGFGSLGTTGDQNPVPIASVTKVMTAYVVLEDHPLDAGESGPDVTVDQQAQAESTSADESSVPVRAGQRLTEHQLLELMLIPSGNNIARLLARWDAGSQDAFVTKMNRAAAGLGMTKTTYTGASGVEDSTTSTSADQLALARAVMKNAMIRSIVATPSVRIEGVPGAVVNTNTLLGRSGVIGLKTGSTTAAGGALMWAAQTTENGSPRLILGVVLHQNPGGTPGEGLTAALSASDRLITGIEDSLGDILANHK
jgi:D-alanyl-D-alanine carboxypeptidase (penicillin-binding protein 5/6)